MRESMGRGVDDISIQELMRMLGAVFFLIVVLLFGEILFRWLIEPANTLLPLQVVEAWLWSSISNIIWPGSTELVAHQTGPMTQVNLLHPSFYSGVVPLYVSDECTGLHELFFLGMMMMLTPSFDYRTKLKHLGIASLIIFVLNMIRLIVLYPLALSGCEGLDSGTFGCESPLFHFHNFVLEYGALIVLVIGWTIWFNISDAREGVKRFWNRLPNYQGISCNPSFEGIGSDTWRVTGLCIFGGIGIFSLLQYLLIALGDSSSVDACIDSISASCTRIITEYEDSKGRMIRLFLVGFVSFLLVRFRPSIKWLDEEEE
ncbi:MAG: hypothetical protein CMB72_01250 [Euryarchaeota archaeon]|nr:hypothetical protein [Euryarchaeota archaeon]